jgi:hypothetical protein
MDAESNVLDHRSSLAKEWRRYVLGGNFGTETLDWCLPAVKKFIYGHYT